jgi:hypothetical protein
MNSKPHAVTDAAGRPVVPHRMVEGPAARGAFGVARRAAVAATVLLRNLRVLKPTMTKESTMTESEAWVAIGSGPMPNDRPSGDDLQER